MTRILASFLCVIFILGPLAGCIANDESSEPSDDASTSTTGDGTNGTSLPDTTPDTPAEPAPSPYDVVCPDGTNETIQWGVATCAEPVVFKAADVSNETLNLTMEWYNVATEAWGNFGPVEVYIIGESVEASKDLEDVFCERHKALDENWNEEWDCANENYQIFSRYPEEGGAAISTFKRTYIDYDFMMMIMSAKYPGPEEDDYKPVTLHEYFHIYQHSHIGDECTGDSRDTCEREAKMGGENKPWFSEGGAEFMAQSLYAQQDGVDENYLRNVMQHKLEMSQEGYTAQDKPLDQLGYDSDVNVYDVGSWFVAYVIHHEGEDAFLNGFYGDLDELGFDAAFEKHFNKTKADYIADFDEFFAQPAEDVMVLFPEILNSEQES
ncbi:hypothetical protein N9289_02450 [Candidatus Poseidonia sp.]|nr:hypothetical protein [Poseidonia sp.]